ncbi:hypothetical protein SAMD00019534_082890 [Acytostelium subglobosum LB1]|uniref:hypothetical protein n=1 Tax=Acytostelium subglobosum LB1 TaxID=1410327 RepID=UPI000644E062|nr:hypothetical protein SAMD00019534_082890 [Acytostelium subglobosum LB1]GAM25114.1 hypothetical protein SAMD00019534_082890 [Acytostelium subglobosum LB1]|eukprot:XP_012752203.1 hypothetical protein SAMD00019534_082890 [Acytostelium subglobosum LB1]
MENFNSSDDYNANTAGGIGNASTSPVGGVYTHQQQYQEQQPTYSPPQQQQQQPTYSPPQQLPPQQQQLRNRSNPNYNNSGDNDSSNNNWVETIKLFDFYPKLDESVPLQKTVYGGMATTICLIFTFFLLCSEMYYYTFPIRNHSLRVDITRGNRLQINLDIHFPSLVCSDINVESVDGIDGRPIKDAAFQLVRERLDKHGVIIDPSNPPPGFFACVPCQLPAGKYSVISAQRCCNDCDSLRSFYRNNKVPQHIADLAPQCLIREPEHDDEGCRIYGTLSVQKMKGDIHMLAGKGVEQQHQGHSHHVHEFTHDQLKRLHKFNISHHIHQFSFGNHVEGLVNPLEGYGVLTHGLGLQTYYIQVVPTIYRQNEYVLETNQYSFTSEYTPITPMRFTNPGLYFKYDMSPLMIEVDQSSKPFVELITSVCAIGGGMYVVFGILYNVIYKVLSKAKAGQKRTK